MSKDEGMHRRPLRWLLIRWIGGPITILALGSAVWAVFVYARGLRHMPCNEMGGFWDDKEQVCYFLKCAGRPGEVSLTTQSTWKCSLRLKVGFFGGAG